MFHVKQVGLSGLESLRFTGAAARRGTGQPVGWLWKFDADFRAKRAGFCGKWRENGRGHPRRGAIIPEADVQAAIQPRSQLVQIDLYPLFAEPENNPRQC